MDREYGAHHPAGGEATAPSIPTTLAERGDRVYAVNARFGTAGPQPAAYPVAQVPK